MGLSHRKSPSRSTGRRALTATGTATTRVWDTTGSSNTRRETPTGCYTAGTDITTRRANFRWSTTPLTLRQASMLRANMFPNLNIEMSSRHSVQYYYYYYCDSHCEMLYISPLFFVCLKYQ